MNVTATRASSQWSGVGRSVRPARLHSGQRHPVIRTRRLVAGSEPEQRVRRGVFPGQFPGDLRRRARAASAAEKLALQRDAPLRRPRVKSGRPGRRGVGDGSGRSPELSSAAPDHAPLSVGKALAEDVVLAHARARAPAPALAAAWTLALVGASFASHQHARAAVLPAPSLPISGTQPGTHAQPDSSTRESRIARLRSMTPFRGTPAAPDGRLVR